MSLQIQLKQLLSTVVILLLITSAYLSAADGFMFNPTDLTDLVFFIESIRGIAIANCNNHTCDTSGDNAPLNLQFCNLDLFPFGCIRRWEDQSPYNGTFDGHPFEPPEWVYGRDFGQDDHEKPGFIPNCINGLPCARGCENNTALGFPQNCSFEIESFNTFTLVRDFSIFHLARQTQQSFDNTLFGVRGLKHNVRDLSLAIALPTIKVTVEGALPFDEWALIELHRDSNHTITCFINRTDVNVQPRIQSTAAFSSGHYLSRYKGADATFGDFALSIVYNRSLNATELDWVRTYIEDIYFDPDVNVSSLLSDVDVDLPPFYTTANGSNYQPPTMKPTAETTDGPHSSTAVVRRSGIACILVSVVSILAVSYAVWL